MNKYHKSFLRSIICSLTLITVQNAQTLPNPNVKLIADGFNKPFGLVFDTVGNILCTSQGDKGRTIINKISPSGNVEKIFESPTKHDDSTRYEMETPGTIELFNDAIIVMDYSSGKVNILSKTFDVIVSSETFGGKVYRKINDVWTAAMCYAMAIDKTNKLLYIGGPYSEQRMFGPVTVFRVNEYNMTDNILGHGKEYYKDENRFLSSMAIYNKNLILAFESEGLFIIKPNNEKEKYTEANILNDKQILGITSDDKNNIYLAANTSLTKGFIYKIDTKRKGIKVLAKDFIVPAGLAIKNGFLYVVDYGKGSIYKLKL